MPAPPLGITARAEVIRWIDADTLVVRIGWPVHVRLRGINAPELGTPEGDAALAYAQKLAPPGSEIIVHVPTSETQSIGHLWSFERIPADAWVHPDNHRSMSELIADHGHAAEAKA